MLSILTMLKVSEKAMLVATFACSVEILWLIPAMHTVMHFQIYNKPSYESMECFYWPVTDISLLRIFNYHNYSHTNYILQYKLMFLLATHRY